MRGGGCLWTCFQRKLSQTPEGLSALSCVTEACLEAEAKPPVMHLASSCFTPPVEQKALSIFIKVLKQDFGGAGL